MSLSVFLLGLLTGIVTRQIIAEFAGWHCASVPEDDE